MTSAERKKMEALRRVAQALVDHDTLEWKAFDSKYPELKGANDHSAMFDKMARMAKAALPKAAS